MTVPLRTGASLRPPPLDRTLIAEPDGIRLWPGARLTERRGPTVVPLAKDAVYQAVARLHGFPAVQTPLWPALQRASALISAGEIAVAQAVLDRLGPLPLSPDGAQLMRAVAARQGIAAPALDLAKGVRLLSERDIARLTPLYDGLAEEAYRLQPRFVPRAVLAKSVWNPALHPRVPAGGTGGGEFAASGAGGLGTASPASTGPRIAAPGTLAGTVGDTALLAAEGTATAAAGVGTLALGGAVAAGLAATTTATGRTDETPVPNRPDLTSRLDQDTGRLTLYRSGDATKAPLLEAATTLDGSLRDSANRLIATPRGDGSLAFNDPVLTTIAPEPHEVPPLPGFPATPPHVPTRVSQPANPMLPAPPPVQDKVQLPAAQVNRPPEDLPDTSIVESQLSDKMKQEAEARGEIWDPIGQQMHHMVAANAPRAAPARKFFEDLDVSVHITPNGMALPTEDHQRLHTNEYYDMVNNHFEDLEKKTDITIDDLLQKLKTLRPKVKKLVKKYKRQAAKGK
jgi:hypothetical protein